MILDVLRMPHPQLKQPAQTIELTQPDLQPFIDDMIDTMYHHPRCVGLAAPQVGKPWRVIVLDAARIDKPGSRHGSLVLLNPQIEVGGGQRLLREGCLSVPDYTGNTLRFELVVVQGLDRHGRPLKIEAHGFEAVVFQHEIDHINGKLFLDRVGSLETDVFRRKNYG